MSPTLEPGDFFMVNTWRYRSHNPSIGEVVVYGKPTEPGIAFVKRVVGVPGDRIEGRDSVLFRNGQPVTEPYLHAVDAGNRDFRNFPNTLVASEEIFVLGDYRDNSRDSRSEGAVAFRNIHGRAEFIWFSFVDGGIRWPRMPRSLRPISDNLATQ
jgi:signal peptidase I